MVKALKTPEVQRRFQDLAMPTIGDTRAEFEAFLKSEDSRSGESRAAFRGEGRLSPQRVIDFRLRPPMRGFLDMVMYADIDRTARMAAGLGMEDSHRRCGSAHPR